MRLDIQHFTDLAEHLDSADELSQYRRRFRQADDNLIYMDGNSLGMMPEESAERVADVLHQEWGERLIRGWNESWWDMPEKAASAIARVIGGEPGEVIVSDSTSVNLYKLVVAWLRAFPGKKKVIVESGIFPTDLYVIEGAIRSAGGDHKMVLLDPGDNFLLDRSKLEQETDGDTALVILSHVSFRSAAMYDMEDITRLVQEAGSAILWDLCHSAGAVPVDLGKCNAEMAVGCTYKYLNAGPGAPAYLYVRKDLIKELGSPLQGWFGDRDPFEFRLDYIPSAGIRRFLSGTPGVLSMSAVEPSVSMLLEAGIQKIRSKSVEMTSLFSSMVEEILVPIGFEHGSPLDPASRGSHYTVKHKEAYRIARALIDPDQGTSLVIPDFRPPDNLRFGFAPLYNSFAELVSVIRELSQIVGNEEYLEYDSEREAVT